MITEIGIVAGEIWHYLDERGPGAMFSELEKGTGRSRDILLMSVGWLAREGYLSLEPVGADYKISFQKHVR